MKVADDGHSAKVLDALFRSRSRTKTVVCGRFLACNDGRDVKRGFSVDLPLTSPSGVEGRTGGANGKLSEHRPQLSWPLVMPAATSTFTISTRGKGTYAITEQVVNFVIGSGVQNGVVTVFVRHTSCSLVIMENADPTARRAGFGQSLSRLSVS